MLEQEDTEMADEEEPLLGNSQNQPDHYNAR
jgi:hypothetical protein